MLGRYNDRAGWPREVVVFRGAAGSRLVVDRDAVTFGARRLVAHLAADEPADNARLICEQYLADPSRGHCRPVVSGDLVAAPLEEELRPEVDCERVLVDGSRRSYRLRPVEGSRSIPDLRWFADSDAMGGDATSLREVIARLESYEPARAMTRSALGRHGGDPRISVCVLRAELERVDASRVVLNRRLREAVLDAMRRDGLSASEIAIRCERIKRDAHGNIAGETSWLARRIGLAPEGGESAPTPWIHSDVLALIARRGLGLSPREVELG
jgi:hypothetical protein